MRGALVKVRVRLFGVLAERAGDAVAVVDVPDEAVAGEVLAAVAVDHPALDALLDRVSVAVNREVVAPAHRVAPGDEVALLPPVAGGAAPARILTGLRPRPSVEEALAAVGAEHAGGTVVFAGTVRSSAREPVDRLEYSAYVEMADAVLGRIAEEAAARWPLAGVAVLHAVGTLAPGETTVVVACSAPHRAEAFDACRHVIDEVKRRVPIWKKEVGPSGERWIGLEDHA